MNFKYSIKSTGSNSEKYGVCEVCNKAVSDVHYQTEFREYRAERWTSDKCFNRFGHKECLESQRRTGSTISSCLDKYGRSILVIQCEKDIFAHCLNYFLRVVESKQKHHASTTSA